MNWNLNVFDILSEKPKWRYLRELRVVCQNRCYLASSKTGLRVALEYHGRQTVLTSLGRHCEKGRKAHGQSSSLFIQSKASRRVLLRH